MTSQTPARPGSYKGAVRRGNAPAVVGWRWLDHLIHVHPVTTVAMFTPVIAACVWSSLGETDGWALVGWAAAGYVTWTLSEYWGHRIVLHYEPEKGFGARLHYILHGIHHDYPTDPRRSILSPALSIPMVGGTIYLASGLGSLPLTFERRLHLRLPQLRPVPPLPAPGHPEDRLMRHLRSLHMRHHFRDDTKGFGISAPYWDELFGTSIARRAPVRRPGHLSPVPTAGPTTRLPGRRGRPAANDSSPKSSMPPRGCPRPPSRRSRPGTSPPHDPLPEPNATREEPMNSETLLARIYTLDPTADTPACPARPAPSARPDPAEANWDEAEEFVRLHHGEHPDQPLPLTARLQQIRTQIDETGTYTHSADELVFGARVAWRNSSRCIGRLYWKSLRVLDRRRATTAEDIHRHLCDHLRQATNGGRIRPVISVFAPDTPESRAPRVWNDQLIRYAGHRQDSGDIVGDPAYAEFTDTVRRWAGMPPAAPGTCCPGSSKPPRTSPSCSTSRGTSSWRSTSATPTAPTSPASDCAGTPYRPSPTCGLRIGGVDYPLAPFNGWYMGTEIGARNLVDADRYDLLRHRRTPRTRHQQRHTLWRDRALVELNVAVLHSFARAGVRISDHHTESRHFMTHLAKEEKQGRTVPADWSWIVPPVSGGITPVFHRYYDEADQRPNFYLDDDAKARGKGGCPFGHG
ncbi:hypothetical protein SGLAM104S_09313 [Streptomyces glaucescens]